MEGRRPKMTGLRHILHAHWPLYGHADLTIDARGDDAVTTRNAPDHGR